MGLEDLFSDYGSGSGSSCSSASWEKWMSPQHSHGTGLKQRSSSYLDLVMNRCTLDDVMREFRMNGSDSPYNPDEDKVWGPPKPSNGISEQLSGMGPPGGYLRQQSWPSATPKPRPMSEWIPRTDFTTSTPVFDESPSSIPEPLPIKTPEITEEQARVLKSLPNDVVYSLLRGFRAEKKRKNNQECRFCKNNGERESYYRSHSLREGARVTCPVLRALVCVRCGARGDSAHTAKYCPLATDTDRQKSMAIMRSMRMASGRRRSGSAASADYVMFGDATPSVVLDNQVYNQYQYTALSAPLDPLWAALEKKLMI